jgi:hypothetical protein
MSTPQPYVEADGEKLRVIFDTDGFDSFGHAYRALNQALFWHDMVPTTGPSGFAYVVSTTHDRAYRLTGYAQDGWKTLRQTGAVEMKAVSDPLNELVEDGWFDFLHPEET